MTDWFKKLFGNNSTQCIDCHYLAKYKSDGMGGVSKIETLAEYERDRIKRNDFDTWLRDVDRLGCYREVWIERAKELNRQERVLIDRPVCRRNNWYREYEECDVSLAQILEDQNGESRNTLFKKIRHAFRLQPGWVYALVSFFIFVVIGLLAIERVREWIFTLF